MATGSSALNQNTAEGQQIAQQLREVQSRLVAQYANQGLSEDQVRNTVKSVSDRFSGARVQLFVPILVERAARELLICACSESSGRHAAH